MTLERRGGEKKSDDDGDDDDNDADVWKKWCVKDLVISFTRR